MIDLQTYRCRIGCFVSKIRTGEPSCMCKSKKGAVPFIDDLLLKSGVEPNPGPKDVFVFRYQYLLVQVGTEVLRKVFDVKVNNDFVAFLNADNARLKQLKFLILKGVISPDQERFLPPVDMNPNSSNYDITLLALLLRHVCGLRRRDDPVWMSTPGPGDMSIEADIVRLRHCRNDLQHRGTVQMSETEFNDKWKDLCMILHRLNVMPGGPQLLQSMIDEAKNVALDEKLKERLDATLKTWEESDKHLQEQIDQLKVEVTNVRGEVTETRQTVTEIKDGLKDVTGDVVTLKSDVAEVRSDVDRVDNKLAVVISDVDRTDSELTVVKSDIDRTDSELTVVKSNVDRTDSELTVVKSAVDRVDSELTVVKSNVDRTDSELTVVKSDVDQVDSELKVVKSDVDRVESELTVVKSNVDQVGSELIVVKSGIDRVDSKLTVVKSDVDRVNSELTLVKSGIDRVESELTLVKDDVKRDVGRVTSDMKHIQDDLREQVGRVDSKMTKVTDDVVDIKSRLDHVEQEVKQQLSTGHSEIQKDLISLYKRKCKALPVSPLFENKDENILKMYQCPSMWSMEGEKQLKKITCYQDIFYKDDELCNQICISGDAGMGKTSLCRLMCFLWSAGKNRDNCDDTYKNYQKDIDSLRQFDFLFYINLRDTECYDVIDMIKECHMKDYHPLMIREIIRTKQCLILMDGLDEWYPNISGKRQFTLPDMMHSEKCAYLTTSRPYRLEKNRLSKSECDHYIQTKGLDNIYTIKSYVDNVISYMNKEHSVERTDNFLEDVDKCGLSDQLCIPIVLTHLVVLWYEKKLTDMTRSLIYANILEMLFYRAQKRNIECPQLTESKRQLPDSFSGFKFLNKYASLLYNVCHLSFRSLFKQDDNSSGIVFTRQQLLSEPHCFSHVETEFLCKIGILSKNELFGCYSEEKLKVSFIHKSYLEFFAALFVSSFDRKHVYPDSIQNWTTLNKVLKFENFLILLSGISYEKVKLSIDNVYKSASDDMELCRNSFFEGLNMLSKFQNMIITCYKEINRYNTINVSLQLEDYVFAYMNNPNLEILKNLLLVNKTHVKFISPYYGQYFSEFDQVTTLKYLHIQIYMIKYNTMFTGLMKRNASTLNALSIHGIRGGMDVAHLPELPLKSLHYLTTLYLFDVVISHERYESLVIYLNEKVNMKMIKLKEVKCNIHKYGHNGCNFILSLNNHSKLYELCLVGVNIVCKNIDTSSLKNVMLRPLSQGIVTSSYDDLFNCLKLSQVERLFIDGDSMLDYNTLKTLILIVRTLPCLKYLILYCMELPVDVMLQLHPDIKQAEINLDYITIRSGWFKPFIDSLRQNGADIKVSLYKSIITSHENGNYRQMSENESVKCMSELLSQIHTINITHKGDDILKIETTSSH